MAKPISKDYLVKQLRNYDSQILNNKYVQQEDGKGLFSGNYNNLTEAPIINLVGTLSNTVIVTTLSDGLYKIKGQYKISASDDTTYLSANGDLLIVDENYIKRITKDAINNYIVNDGVVTKVTYVTDDEIETIINNKFDDEIQSISNEVIENLF